MENNQEDEKLKEGYVSHLLSWQNESNLKKRNKLSDGQGKLEEVIFSQGKQDIFLDLMDHPERVVRFNAAGICLVLDEPKARQVLEELAKGGRFSLEAKYALIEFDKGPLKERLQKLLALSKKGNQS